MSDSRQLRAVAGTPGPHESRVPSSRALGRTGRRQRRRHRLAGLVRLAVFLLLIFVAVWAGVRVAHAGEDGSIYTGHHYVVQQGDDLWTIASGEYGDQVDLRAAVHSIRRASQLRTSVLQPGQEIILPHLEE